MYQEIIEKLCTRINSSRFPQVDFHRCSLSIDDLDLMKKEFGQTDSDSEFDPLKIRQKMYEGWLSGSKIATCHANKLAKIIVLSRKGFSLDRSSLSLWSWILASFCPHGMVGRIRIFFIADESLRRFPEDGFNGGEIGPQNINGGYTYPCLKNLDIFIYRIEDATRVLIHELLHAFCTDRHETGVDIIEAKTEAWAELIWCCFMAEGNVVKSIKNFEAQIGWVVLQNERVKEFIGDDGISNRKFPWRYTIAKEEVFRIWMGQGNLIKFKKNVGGPLGESLRLTNPYIVICHFQGSKTPTF